MSTATGSMAALSAYRNILRATQVAFKGDQRILISAREQIRASYLKDRALAAGSAEAGERIQHAEEVARFLRQNVVQGEKLETGAGATTSGGEQEGREDRYRLNIHEETERGDNEVNRMPKEEMGSLGGARARRFNKI